jgi:hypothetical protein
MKINTILGILTLGEGRGREAAKRIEPMEKKVYGGTEQG